MSASPLRRSPRLAASAATTTPPKKAVALPDMLLKPREATPVTTPLRRSRRLAGLQPAPPARAAYVYTPPDTLEAAAAIGREAYRLHPVAWMAPDVADKELYVRLVHLTSISMGRILLTGDSGRFRTLTKAEALAWVHREHDKFHILVLRGMIRSWMLAPSGKWRVRNWEEEHVEIAMRQHPGFMAVLEAAMGPPLKGGF